MDNPGSSQPVAAIAIRHETDGINSWVAYRLTFTDGTQLDIAGHSDELDAAREQLRLEPEQPVHLSFPLTLHYNPAGGRDGF